MINKDLKSLFQGETLAFVVSEPLVAKHLNFEPREGLTGLIDLLISADMRQHEREAKPLQTAKSLQQKCTLCCVRYTQGAIWSRRYMRIFEPSWHMIPGRESTLINGTPPLHRAWRDKIRELSALRTNH